MTFTETQIAEKVAELTAWAADKGPHTLVGISAANDRAMALQALRADATFANLRRIGGSVNVVR